MKITENIHIIPVGDLEVNCTVVKCGLTGKIAVFDPGDESEKIIRLISDIGGEPVMIINTHCHHDHIGAVEDLKKKYNVKHLVHELEKEYSEDPKKNYSTHTGTTMKIVPDGTFRHGDIIESGSLKIKVIHTPGHTLGGCCFHFGNILISGDTLFAGSVGRADLYGGNENILIESIKTRLMILADDTIVIPGHGRLTTIREEKRFNPFL
jgi:hydroxyacylglutathione hydrolase